MTQTIINLGTGGAALNGQNGSTAGADSNDALFLDWPGDNAGNYVYLPNVTANMLTVPDEAALDITDEIDLRIWIAPDSWTSQTDMLITKDNNTTQISYRFILNSSGTLTFNWSVDGSSRRGVTSTVAVPFSDGDDGWLRITFIEDNGSSQSEIKFFTSTNGSTWTQLGSTLTSTTGAMFVSTTQIEVGSFANGFSTLAGKVYRAQILDGIDGTTVLDVDTSVISSGSATSFTAVTGQTVTINRSTSGRKSVAVVAPVWLFGTDDYMEIADNDLLDFGATDSFTVVAVIRQWATPVNFGRYVDKRDSGTVGYQFASLGTTISINAVIDDGPNIVNRTSATVAAGSLSLAGMVVDRLAETVQAISGGVLSATSSISGFGTLANADPLRIGRTSTGTTYQDFELLAVAVFRRTLSVEEIASITTYYQNKVA